MRLSIGNKIEYKQAQSPVITDKIGFKGASHSAIKAISSAMDGCKALTSYSSSFDTISALNSIRKRIGKSAEVLFKHIKEDELISHGLVQDGNKIKFKNKKPLRLLIDGILYPIAKIPFYILYGGLNLLKKMKVVKNSKWLKSFEESSFYSITHSYLKKDDKLNALRGLMEIGSMKNVNGVKDKMFLINTAKTFDPKSGNYNGVHERALTRIVTGFIPAFFLANDAHNLSILCNNNKKEANVEKDLRFKQETRRVLSNAYIQLITLGALAKFINKSKAWFVGVTVGSVLLTEIYSRLKTGKKIHFISPKEAKEINKKERIENTREKINKGYSFVLDTAPTPFKVSMNGVNKFIENPNENKFKDLLKPKNKISKDKDNKAKSRALVTLGTFFKVVGGIIAAGFVIKGLKKVPLGKGKHVDDIFKSIAAKYQKFYNGITMKPNHIQKADMDKILEKMNKCSFGTIAEGYKKTILDYQRLKELPKHIGDDIIEFLEKSKNSELAKYIKELKSPTNIKKVLAPLKNEIIDCNFKNFVEYLKKSKQQDLLNEINKIMADSKDISANYPKFKKLLGKIDDENLKTIFENIYAVDENSVKSALLEKAKEAVTKGNKGHLWRSAENAAQKEIESRSYYDLGETKIPVLKDVIDFCIEPFKFAWGIVSSPYRYLYKIKDIAKTTPQKGINDIDVIAKALTSLNKKVSMNDKAFTDMFNEKIVKGFNYMTMSKIANSELSSIAKTVSTITTMSFLISDNYNMVMLKSNGENVEEANLKGKERFIQEMSRFLWQQMFINMFNNSFAGTYNASLLGASVVNTASTLATETCTRKAVGLPISSVSKEQIIQLEKDNLSGNGLKSKFFRFMSKLTGKQVLSERETVKKK